MTYETPGFGIVAYDHDLASVPMTCICLDNGWELIGDRRVPCSLRCPARTRWLTENPQPGTVWPDGTED